MRRKFLTARWCNLILANFAVPEELLRPLVPPGCELDHREGACWASLAGFQFLDTRVLGVGWPGYRNFPEWNLRFYVRRGEQRGVCFVREFVPQRLVAWLARTLYHEPYAAAPMRPSVTEAGGAVTAEYGVRAGGRWHTLRATGARAALRPAADSPEHFFKEHQWGFGVTRRGRALRYEVRHPHWNVFPVRDFALDVDW